MGRSKRMRKRKPDLVYLRICPTCGSMLEIDGTDNYEMFEAMSAGELFVMERREFQAMENANKGFIGNRCLN